LKKIEKIFLVILGKNGNGGDGRKWKTKIGRITIFWKLRSARPPRGGAITIFYHLPQ
jgi:hypothetical protein